VTAAWAPRALLMAIAAGALLWLGHGLRAVHLDAEGKSRLQGSGARPDPATAADARSLFRRAARHNADPTPELDEATLLIRLGRRREAARLLESVVDANPGSIRGWGLLATATATFDADRSTEANGELLKLYGRAQGQPLALGSIRAGTGRRYIVTPGALRGAVEASRLGRSYAIITGWATTARDHVPAEAVMAISHGHVVATVAPRRRREDVARRFGRRAALSGYILVVPRGHLVDEHGELDLHVFAAARGQASPIRFRCASKAHNLAC
jgi:hypothetical protein